MSEKEIYLKDDNKEGGWGGCILVVLVAAAVAYWFFTDKAKTPNDILGRDSVRVEMLDSFGEWEEMFMLYGYYDNKEAALEMIELLHEKYGREYRIKE